MDNNLKHIIKSITYIEWPGADDKKKIDDFWEKLKLAMPKVKNQPPVNAKIEQAA